MAWNTGISYGSGAAVTAALLNGIGADLRTFGGDVDGGGYSLANFIAKPITARIGTTTLLGSLLTVCPSGGDNAAADAQGEASIVGPDAGAPFGNLTVHSNTALAADKGASIAFATRYITSSPNAANMALIRGCKASATSTELIGYLAFLVRNTAMTEIARVTKDGLAIGGTSVSVSGTGHLHCIGDTVRLTPTSRTPANSAATGNDGEYCADSSYVYVHTGGSWRRAALSTF